MLKFTNEQREKLRVMKSKLIEGFGQALCICAYVCGLMVDAAACFAYFFLLLFGLPIIARFIYAFF